MKLLAKLFSTCVLAVLVALGPTAATAAKLKDGSQRYRAPVVFKAGRPGVGLKRWSLFSKKKEESDEDRGGHRKNQRESNRQKHEEGDERRKRDQGGEKKDKKHDDGRNAWKKRRGG